MLYNFNLNTVDNIDTLQAAAAGQTAAAATAAARTVTARAATPRRRTGDAGGRRRSPAEERRGDETDQSRAGTS